MIEDIQAVFAFIGCLDDVAEHLYTTVAPFVVSVYFLGMAGLVRLVLSLLLWRSDPDT